MTGGFFVSIYPLTAMKEIHKIRLLKISMEIFGRIGTPEQLKAKIGATGIFIDYFDKLKHPGIQFNFPCTNDINCCQIILNNGSGLYFAKFFASRKRGVSNFIIRTDIPAEDICNVFCEITGLSLSS
jgi:hypothetical protein